MIILIKNVKSHVSIKRINIHHNYIQEFITNEKLVIKSGCSINIFEDSFTKALTVDNFC